MSGSRWFLPALVAAPLLGGCHLLAKLEPNCHSKQEYRAARQVAPLIVPTGLDAPNTQGSLTIPTVGVAPPPPGPSEQCLDIPPKYVKSPTTKSQSS